MNLIGLIRLPFQVIGAVAEGVMLGWAVTHHPSGVDVTRVPRGWITDQGLADAEAERDTWEPGELTDFEHAMALYETSSTPSASEFAAFAIREWIAGETCDAPTFFATIADDLLEASK